MPVFRFLHASDLHIAAEPRVIGFVDAWAHGKPWLGFLRQGRASSHDPDVLEGLAAFAYLRRDEIDAVLLSGDLATTGARADLAAASEFVRKPAVDLWLAAAADTRVQEIPTLQACGRPVLVVPGNHDRFDGWRFEPGGRAFDELFGDEWAVGQSAQVLAVLGKGGHTLGLIGADLTLKEGERGTVVGGRWGQGTAYTDVIEEAVDLTEDLRQRHEGIAILWVVHFPPQFPGVSASLQLLDDDGFVEAAAAHGVSAILAGHTHDPLEYTAAAPSSGQVVEVLCAGSATQYSELLGNTIHLVEVDVTGTGPVGLRREDLRWHSAAGTPHGVWLPC